MNRPADNTMLRKFNRLVAKQANGCWMFATSDGTKDGYAMFLPYPGAKKVAAHRWAYETFIGPIPDGLQIDHVCHSEDTTCPGGHDCPHRRCCNPAHLEAVTGSENTIRQRHAERAKTECPKGHPYDAENTYVDPSGRRRCRACKRGSTPPRPSLLEP